jgi:hypothetical protein
MVTSISPVYNVARKFHILSILFCPDNSSKPSENLVSQSWEWREGRLLAYELILKFLIANHIHYLFPTFALPRSNASASASVDENLIR